MDAAPCEHEPLVGRIGAGDEDAARELVTRLHSLVMSIARAYRLQRLGEDDLAQMIFARVFERLPGYEPRPGVPLEHWVSRLAVRVCLDALRAERRRPETRWSDLGDGERDWLDHLVSDDAPQPDGNAADARELVDRLLSRLSTEDRGLIRWLDLDGKSVAEVATLTGWSAVRVRVRAFRARGCLRRVARELFNDRTP